MTFEVGNKHSKGRSLGAPNKRTDGLAQAVAGAAKPLEFLHRLMNDVDNPLDRRIDAAKALLPHFHKKQPVAVEVDTNRNDRIVELLQAVYGRPADEAPDAGPVQ